MAQRYASSPPASLQRPSSRQKHSARELPLFELFHWRARAEQIPIAVDVVDAASCGPEFVVARPRRGKSCLLARVGTVPLVGRDLSGGMRRVLEQIALPILFSVGDCLHLCVNGDHRIAETI